MKKFMRKKNVCKNVAYYHCEKFLKINLMFDTVNAEYKQNFKKEILLKI